MVGDIRDQSQGPHGAKGRLDMDRNDSPTVQLQQMMREFKQSSRDILTITHQEIIEYEKGLYGRIYAKLSRRLSNTLSVDREILVMVSNFADQQARTIAFVHKSILESQPRLESAVAVVIHKDPRGNLKLKNWGRDIGLSVLPLYMEYSLPSGDELERCLCWELFSHDPFDITGPVSDDSQFYGRRDEALDLARKLQGGQIRSCLGIRKVGKTSILNRVINEARSNHSCLCIMIDCSKDMIWSMRANQIVDAIAEAVISTNEISSNYISVESSSTTKNISECSIKLEKAVIAHRCPVILFMDEVDYITPTSPTGFHWKNDFNTLWRNLRAVYQEITRQSALMSIVVSSVSSRWFTVESIDGTENAALAFIPEEYVSPLPRGATIAMLKRLGRSAGLLFNTETATRVADVCSDMPYWARKASSFIHRNIEIDIRPVSLDMETVDNLLTDFIHSEGAAIAQVALRHLLRVYPELEDPVIACSIGKGEQVSQYYLAILEKYGVISKSPLWGTPNASYSLSGRMIQEGFRIYLERKEEAASSRATTTSATSTVPDSAELDEWAEELAVINRRRNLLEKRLRQVVLNFIRYDSLVSSTTESTAERVASVLPSWRRDKMVSLNAEDTVEKFMWTDLVKLISREWKLFERIFGDKQRFLADCDIINDRFDAHAKDFDSADMALYRRCLKHIEDSIAKL